MEARTPSVAEIRDNRLQAICGVDSHSGFSLPAVHNVNGGWEWGVGWGGGESVRHVTAFLKVCCYQFSFLFIDALSFCLLNN